MAPKNSKPTSFGFDGELLKARVAFGKRCLSDSSHRTLPQTLDNLVSHLLEHPHKILPAWAQGAGRLVRQCRCHGCVDW